MPVKKLELNTKIKFDCWNRGGNRFTRDCVKSAEKDANKNEKSKLRLEITMMRIILMKLFLRVLKSCPRNISG